MARQSGIPQRPAEVVDPQSNMGGSPPCRPQEDSTMKKLMCITIVLLLAVTLQSAAVLASDTAPAANARQMGDVVYDNNINLQDMLAVRDHIFGEVLTGDDYIAADLYFRDEINLDNILFIRDIMFGDKFSPSWPGTKPPFSGQVNISGSPPIDISVYYNSMDDMISDIAHGYSEDVMAEIDRIDEYLGRKKTETFRDFLVSRQANDLYVPFYKGEKMQLEENEGFYSIGVKNKYIYFRPDKHDIYISTRYLDELNPDEIKNANEIGFLDACKQLYPETDFTDPNRIKSFEEKERKLGDRNVKTLERVNDWDISIDFFYGNIRVYISGPPEVLTPEWLSNLEFRNVLLK